MRQVARVRYQSTSEVRRSASDEIYMVYESFINLFYYEVKFNYLKKIENSFI
jgi:hypothetical protein